MLISPQYRDLQHDLHAKGDYGIGVHANECAVIVSELGVETEFATVLDYGSGPSSHIAKLLPQYKVADYDPCITGKTAEPSSADVLVCSDVLEHIEPSHLDSVLQHIRKLARKRVVLVIATVPANKTLSDGRNAHLIVEDANWWTSRLVNHFFIDHMEARAGRIILVGRSRPFEIGKVNVTAAVDNDERNKNVRINCATVAKRLDIRMPQHDRKAIVVCAGPSLRDTWPTVALSQARGADVYSCSISHKFLLDRNIVPVAHMDCDPREHKVRQFGEPDNRVQYWLASCVHPSYLEKLRGYDVSLWHSYNGKESEEIFNIDPGHEIVTGGGSIGLRALSVLYCRGYRMFDIHGMDSSYAPDGTDHCGVHLGKKLDTIETICGGKVFLSTAVNIAYARYFFKSQQMLKGATFSFYGDGLLPEMVKQGMRPDAIFDETGDD